jgi:hypothetical protein
MIILEVADPVKKSTVTAIYLGSRKITPFNRIDCEVSMTHPPLAAKYIGR